MMFAKRSEEKEFLDDLQCEGDDLRQNLKELKFINKWLGGNKVTESGLGRALTGMPANKGLRIADLGCGGGDILELIARWGRKRKRSFQLTGIDANAYIIKYAKDNTFGFPEIKYQQLNIFSEEFSNMRFDIVNCTLFCHHFDDKTLIKLFSQLKKQTRIAVVINDLHRHWLAYYSIKLLTALFSRSKMVKNDARLSVLRGFKRQELEAIILQSGYIDFSIKWKWAFRWEIVMKS